MKKEKQIVFICRKCEHNLFMNQKEGWLKKLLKLDCPNCGEESYELWILQGFGDFEKWEGEKI